MLLAESLLGTSSVDANFIEDVFSTYLYTGNGSTQTITNGIDLSTYGGLVWTKCRNDGTLAHRLNDTSRGITQRLFSNLTNAQSNSATSITAVSSTGYTVGSENGFNQSSNTFASWTFRKQAKFFDVVTYTGNGTAGRTISHNLGAEPGCIIIKKTSDTENWGVYHRSLGNTASLALNLTNASGGGFWNNTTPTATVFTIGNQGQVNDNGQTYVAYLFAHDAGGFGATGADNVISCGSYTGNGSATGPTITLGYEPQLVITKRTNNISDWVIFDTMRGMSETSANLLYPNLSDDEGIGTAAWVVPTATGFKLANASSTVNANGSTYIYIAIRRGPMRTPTTGTSVFSPQLYTGNDLATQTFAHTFGQSPDLMIIKNRSGGTEDAVTNTRLTGTAYLRPATANAEADATAYFWKIPDQNSFYIGEDNRVNGPSYTYANWMFRRAPGFFDVVCYTGDGTTGRQVSHNLGVKPELVIYKFRNDTGNWTVFTNYDYEMYLNLTTALQGPGYSGNHGDPTATYLVAQGGSNTNTRTIVSYLFATVAGVSKVFSYTGNGSNQTINCGFTGGARFVLIKRTDSTGDWYVWDSARGIVAANDPHLSLNSTAAEVTTDDSVDTDSSGFIVNQVAATNINVNAATYIGLAIA